MIRRLFRRGGGLTEVRLWDRLDKCGINFRAPMSELIARYGCHPLGWADGIDICPMEGARPFVDGQTDPMVFDFTDQTDLSKPPPLLRCAVRNSPDFRINYARAIAGLVKHFGEGEDDTHDNAVGRLWQMGPARVTCHVIPPDRVDPAIPSKRNAMFPDRAVEAAILIVPGAS